VLPGDRLQPLQETVARNNDAGFSLDGLDHNADCIFRHRFFDRFEVVVRNYFESRGERAVIVRSVGIYRERNNGDGSSVKVVFKDDDLRLVLLNSLDHVPPFSHSLQSRFHRLGSGIHGEYHLFSREIGKFLREDRPTVVEEGAGSQGEDISLIFQSFDDLWMSVPLVDCGVCG